MRSCRPRVAEPGDIASARGSSVLVVDSTVAMVVPAVTGLAGVALGYAGTRHISKIERNAATAAELRRAAAVYLAALYPLVAELLATPEVKPTSVGQTLDRLSGEAATYVRSRRQIAKLGSRPWDLGDRFATATANLQVLALPVSLAAAVAKANDFVEQLSSTRSDELKDRWPEIWEQLHSAIKLLPA
jgi:predicted component of type VI protein secretion system